MTLSPDQITSMIVEATQVPGQSEVAIGFDVAANADNWGLCVIHLTERDSVYRAVTMPLVLPQARVNASGRASSTLLCRPTEETLVTLVTALVESGVKVSMGVDIPFGWPSEQASFLGNWSALSVRSSSIEIPEKDSFCRRLTDRELNRNYPSIKPLAVGADKLSAAAFRWSQLRQLFPTAGWEVDLGCAPVSNSFAVFESYPAAFVKLCASEFGNYKKKPAVRRRILSRFTNYYQLTVSTEQSEWLEWACEQNGSPDAFDAFLCALTAIDHLRNRREPNVNLTTPHALLGHAPNDTEMEQIVKEGWILVRDGDDSDCAMDAP